MSEANLSPITAAADEPLAKVVGLMREHGVSQVPIKDGANLTSIVHEADILRGLREHRLSPDSPVKEAAQRISGLIYPKARLEELFHIFETDHVAVVVDGGEVCGVIAQIDLIEHLAKREREPVVEGTAS